MSGAAVPVGANSAGRERQVVQMLTTCPPEHADRIARTLVDERLAACVQRIDGVRSTYRWQDAIETATESLLLIKTCTDRVDEVLTRLVALHPYEVPELLTMPVGGLSAYLAYVREAV